MRHRPSFFFVFVVAALALTPSFARAADSAESLLSALVKNPSSDEAKKVLDSLAARGPDVVPELKKFLDREHKSSDADRRAVLKRISAQVPNKKGRFSTPRRQKAEEKKRNDELDWLADLVKLSPSQGLGEVVADVVAIRALAANKDPSAGNVILDFAFSELGLVYRDECGRYLRKMSPVSLPALAAASVQRRKSPSKARYSTYQLERLDRQNADKAMLAAEPDSLKVALLKAYADSQFREAVYAVLGHTNHPSVPVREAARAAWMEYVAGRPPRPAPKRKLVEPGGKLSDEKQPLWLDHRELADVLLRRTIEKELGQKPAKSASLTDMSKQLFAHYDAGRSDALSKDFTLGKKAAGGKNWVEAARLFDRVLARDPEYAQRGEMTETYFRLGKSLEKEKKHAEAAIAFGKAEATSKDPKRAKEALAAHLLNRGKARAKGGEDAAEDLARAREIDPEGAGAGAGRKKWLLYGGIAWLAGGLLLLVVGIVRRRRV